MTGRRTAMLVAALLLLLLASGGDLRAGVAAGLARVVSHGSRSVRTIALTFDDGISPQNCRRILAELVGRGVPATFFPMADAMRLDPSFWRLVARAGYPVGDHTLTHPHMPRLGYSSQRRQLTDSRALVEAILGRPMLRVFRPPYGEYDGTTLAAATGAGFPTVLLWDTSDRDTSLHGTVDQKLAAAERGSNGSVVLLHCGPNATPYLLPDLIAFYRSRGFRFVTVPTLLGLPWSPGPTASLSPSEILGGISPLPSSPSGGPILGIEGVGTASPFASAAVPTASASPEASATAPSSAAPGSGSDVPREAGPSPTASPVGSGDAGGPLPIGALLAAAAVAVLAVPLLTIAAVRRRHR